MSTATLPTPTTVPRSSRASRGQVPVGGLLTPRAERMIRWGSLGSAVVIAVCAMVLSYAGLHDLALDAQIPPGLALLVPIMVDGLQFVGSLGVIYSTLSGLRSWYPWMLMLMGVSISAWGNWQAAPDVMTAKLLHAAAPLILALVLEELLRVMRHKVSVHAHAESLVDQETQDTEGSKNGAGVTPVREVVPEVAAEALPQPMSASVQAEVLLESSAPTEPEPVASQASTLVDEQPAQSQAATQGEGEASTWQMRERIVSLTELRSPNGDSAPASPDTTATADSRVTQGEPTPTREPVRPAESTGLSVVSDDDEDGPDDNEDSLPSYPDSGTLKEQIAAVLEQDDSIPAARIARVMDREPSYVRKLVREVKKEMSQSGTRPRTRPVQANQGAVPVSGEGSAHGDRDLRSIDPFSVGTSAEYATN